MSESLYLLTICLPLATILLVFGIRSVASVQQAKARLAHDADYQAIAQTAASAAARTAASLATIEVSLAGIERVLKNV